MIIADVCVNVTANNIQQNIFYPLKKEYYDVNDINFKWPKLSHGSYNSEEKYTCVNGA